MYRQLTECTVQGTTESCTGPVILTVGLLQICTGFVLHSWPDKAAHDAWPDTASDGILQDITAQVLH